MVAVTRAAMLMTMPVFAHCMMSNNYIYKLQPHLQPVPISGDTQA